MRRAGLALAALAALACAHGEPDLAVLSSNSDQLIWEAGRQAYDKKQWESARKHFQRIVDGFPQSEYGPGARLGVADSYFGEGGSASYILAISAYREFLTLYPSHPTSAYAQFQVAEAYYLQRNKPDRDQTNTERALAEYQRLLDVYPASPKAEEARRRVRECRQSLARSEFLAGYFYQRTRQAWRAAISRYEGILSEYPDYEDLDDVLMRLAEALASSGRQAEALPHLGRLLAEYPQSEHADDARRLMDDLGRSPGVVPPPSPPPPPAQPSVAPRRP